MKKPTKRPAAARAGGARRFEESKHPRGPGGRFKTVTRVKEKAFTGEQLPVRRRLSKLETDAEGEAVALAYLQKAGLKDAQRLNIKGNNFPIDIKAGNFAIELKCGLVSNSPGAQQWRITLGQPGPAETELLKRMSPEKKLAHNAKKMQHILGRKVDALKALGSKYKPRTMCLILNPDTRRADIYMLDGYHQRIGWKSKELTKAFVGTFAY